TSAKRDWSADVCSSELPLPPPLAKGGVRVTPLGGLGEVGRNMTVIEHDGQLLIVDCGVLFPEDHQPGVDLILPDFETILERIDDIQAIVFTHGHHVHLCAEPYEILPQRVILL